MTVEELIKELKKANPKAVVKIWKENFLHDFNDDEVNTLSDEVWLG